MSSQKTVLLATLLLTLGAAGSAHASPEQLRDGRERLAKGDARGAMIRFEQAVRDDPSDAAARLGLARALLVLGDAERAEKMAAAAVRDAEEGGEDGRVVHAEALLALGRFADARTVAEAAPEGTPDRAAVLGLADAELALADAEPETALGALRPPLDAERFAGQARLVAARAQYARGDLVRAQALIDDLLAAEEASFPALLLRARLAMRAGDAVRAGELADAMLALDPGNVSAGAVAIEAALRRDDLGEARARLAALEPLGQDDPRPAYLSALVLLREGKTREASDAVASIERWLEGTPGGAVLLGRLKLETGRLAQAERVLSGRVLSAPEDAQARALLIRAYEAAGKDDKAAEALEEGLSLTPDAPALRQARARRLLGKGRTDEALAAFGEAPGPAGRLATALFGGEALGAPPAPGVFLAYAALSAGDTRAAIEAASAAAEEAEDASARAVALNVLAAAQLRAGQEGAARANLDKALEADPGFLAAILNRARLDPEDGALLSRLEASKRAGASTAPFLRQLAAERFVAGNAEGAVAAADEAARLSVGDGPVDDATTILLAERLRLAADGVPTDRLATLLEDDETSPASVLEGAALAEAAGDVARAAAATTALARRTNDPSHLMAATRALRVADQAEEALRLVTRARAERPDDARLAREAIALTATVGGEEAGLALAEALAEEGVLGGPLARATALRAAGDDAAALEALEDAATPAGLRMRLTLAKGTPAEEAAAGALEAWVQTHPGDVPSLVLLGAVHAEAGRKAQAEGAIRRALAASPGDPVLLSNAASLRLGLGDADGADALSRAAYASAPGRPAVAQTRAEVLMARGDADGARRVLRRALIAAPGDAELRAALAAG